MSCSGINQLYALMLQWCHWICEISIKFCMQNHARDLAGGTHAHGASRRHKVVCAVMSGLRVRRGSTSHFAWLSAPFFVDKGSGTTGKGDADARCSWCMVHGAWCTALLHAHALTGDGGELAGVIPDSVLEEEAGPGGSGGSVQCY